MTELRPAKNRRGWRSVRQLDDGRWQVACRGCPRRIGRRLFATFGECRDWWGEHRETAGHQACIDVGHLMELRDMDAIWASVFGPDYKGQAVLRDVRLPPTPDRQVAS